MNPYADLHDKIIYLGMYIEWLGFWISLEDVLQWVVLLVIGWISLEVISKTVR